MKSAGAQLTWQWFFGKFTASTGNTTATIEKRGAGEWRAVVTFDVHRKARKIVAEKFPTRSSCAAWAFGQMVPGVTPPPMHFERAARQ